MLLLLIGLGTAAVLAIFNGRRGPRGPRRVREDVSATPASHRTCVVILRAVALFQLAGRVQDFADLVVGQAIQLPDVVVPRVFALLGSGGLRFMKPYVLQH